MEKIKKLLPRIDPRNYYIVFIIFNLPLLLSNLNKLTNRIDEYIIFVAVVIMSIIMNLASLAALFVWKKGMDKVERRLIYMFIILTIISQGSYFIIN